MDVTCKAPARTIQSMGSHPVKGDIRFTEGTMTSKCSCTFPSLTARMQTKSSQGLDACLSKSDQTKHIGTEEKTRVRKARIREDKSTGHCS